MTLMNALFGEGFVRAICHLPGFIVSPVALRFDCGVE